MLNTYVYICIRPSICTIVHVHKCMEVDCIRVFVEMPVYNLLVCEDKNI
jgi:hypothetical protein